jgi:hypothetical protein
MPCLRGAAVGPDLKADFVRNTSTVKSMSGKTAMEDGRMSADTGGGARDNG